MQVEQATSWFGKAVELLGVRRGHRLLAIEPRLGEAVALRAAVGDTGELTLVLRARDRAEWLAERAWPQVRVLCHDVDGGETFGSFDALLIAPAAGPLLPPDGYAALARSNLRPGGRAVVDLPAPDMLPDLHKAWQQLGWDEERLRPFLGPDDVELADALRSAGMRSVQVADGTHLLHHPSPIELVATFADELDLNDDELGELARTIIHHRQDAGPIDALVHRTRVAAQR
ncbi:MAG TPA: hypothetical protein ENI87_04830 [bacterium]|nr:hypothetical protein [bacterium]